MVKATYTERGREPLHVAALVATAVLSAFVLLTAAAGIAQVVACHAARSAPLAIGSVGAHY